MVLFDVGVVSNDVFFIDNIFDNLFLLLAFQFFIYFFYSFFLYRKSKKYLKFYDENIKIYFNSII